MNTEWHFPFMVLASFVLFFAVIRVVIGKEQFSLRFRKVVALSLICVVAGMVFGKYGATAGLPWWIYYPIPMLMNVFLPPLVLHMNRNQVFLYLILSFLSAPIIHVVFSFFLDWHEYMPFWNIPFIGTMLH